MAITLSEEERDFSSTHPIYNYDLGTDTLTLVANYTSFDYFPDTAGVGDAIYFGVEYRHPPTHKIKLNVGTALVADAITIKWYYTTCRYPLDRWDTLQWNEITVTDGTNSFQTIGENTIEFDVPKDWTMHSNSLRQYFLKAEIDSVTNLTEGGANTTTAKNYFNRITLTGGYATGSSTNAGDTNRVLDTSKTWAADMSELGTGRHVLFTSGDNEGDCYPISRDYHPTAFFLGVPRCFTTYNVFVYLDNATAVGDDYLIGYTMEDIYNEDVANGWGLVEQIDHNPIKERASAYVIKAEIFLSASSGNPVLLSTMAQTLVFYPGFSFESGTGWGPAEADIGKIASGMRFAAFEKTGAGTYQQAGQTEDVCGLGSVFSFDAWSFLGITPWIAGYLYDTTILNGCGSTWNNRIQLRHADIRQSSIQNAQISGTHSTGSDLTHAPISEPLRNVGSTWQIENFKSNSTLHYATASGDFLLDGGGSQDWRPFTCYHGFTDNATFTMIDPSQETPLLFQWVAPAGTQSTASVYFKYRFYVKVVDRHDNVLEGASITVKNTNGTTEFTDTTGADGNATGDGTNKVTFLKLTHDGTGNGVDKSIETHYSPFRIKITKSGYQEKEITLTPDQKTYLNITMEEELSSNQHESVELRR